MIYDGCENPYHAGCVGLSEVPKEDWFCPKCRGRDFQWNHRISYKFYSVTADVGKHCISLKFKLRKLL